MAEVLSTVDSARTEKTPYATRYDNFIGGKWTPPLSGRYFDNPSPVFHHDGASQEALAATAAWLAEKLPV